MPEILADVGSCVEAVLRRVGLRVVLALPLGIGKPNPLVNEFYRRALRDPKIDLTIITALSLLKPVARSALEARLVAPLVERIFGSYVEPDYARAVRHGSVPANVRVIEFYLAPGRIPRRQPCAAQLPERQLHARGARSACARGQRHRAPGCAAHSRRPDAA